jgi:hypothetical protein
MQLHIVHDDAGDRRATGANGERFDRSSGTPQTAEAGTGMAPALLTKSRPEKNGVTFLCDELRYSIAP